MNIMITGGCGFVGSSLSIFLKKNLKNSKILSIDNLSKSYSKFNQAILSKNKIKNEKINLGNPNSLNKIPRLKCASENSGQIPIALS